MDYKGYKITDDVLLVSRENHSNQSDEIKQAYVVDPKNKSQKESAIRWAEWPEWIYDSDKKEYTGKIEHKPIETLTENRGFKLSICDCAGGSSQGGKLSFWNCILEKDDKQYKIGINSEMLLNVLKEGTFIKGVCKEPVCFASKSGRCGVVIENGPSYIEARGDMELKETISKSLTTKYGFGANICTATIDDIYLGKYYRFWRFEDSRDSWERMRNEEPKYPERFKFIKLKKPEPIYLFAWRGERKNVSEYLDAWLSTNTSLPRRMIGDNPIFLDINQDEFSGLMYEKFSTLDYASNMYRVEESSDFKKLVYTASNYLFGVSMEYRDLDEEIERIIKAFKIKVVEE